MKSLLLLFLLLSFGLSFVSSVKSHEVAGKKTIHLRSIRYEPQNIQINKGEAIVFENTTDEDHWPASNLHPTHAIYPEFDPKKPIKPGDSWEFTFEREGKWYYHDHLYPEITGMIIVRESDNNQNLVVKLQKYFISYFKSLGSFINNLYRYDASIPENTDKILSDDNALYSYIKKYGPAKTTESLYSLTPESSCHQRAHTTGRLAYEIYKEKAFQLCSGECHSGCYHGATEAYFREKGTANIVDDLKTICGSASNKFYASQCLHGVGHGLMAWSNYELNEALELCEILPEGANLCWSGVFMENAVGALAKDTKEKVDADTHFSKYLNNDPFYPCDFVKEKYQGTCYTYQTSRMIQLDRYDPKKLSKLCSEVSERNQFYCFQSLGRDVSSRHKDPEGAIKDCGVIEDAYDNELCLLGAVQNYFWDVDNQDKAIMFCGQVSQEKKQSCYIKIIDRAKDLLPPEQLETFCNKLGGEYTTLCRER